MDYLFWFQLIFKLITSWQGLFVGTGFCKIKWIFGTVAVVLFFVWLQNYCYFVFEPRTQVWEMPVF